MVRMLARGFRLLVALFVASTAHRVVSLQLGVMGLGGTRWIYAAWALFAVVLFLLGPFRSVGIVRRVMGMSGVGRRGGMFRDLPTLGDGELPTRRVAWEDVIDPAVVMTTRTGETFVGDYAQLVEDAETDEWDQAQIDWDAEYEKHLAAEDPEPAAPEQRQVAGDLGSLVLVGADDNRGLPGAAAKRRRRKK